MRYLATVLEILQPSKGIDDPSKLHFPGNYHNSPSLDSVFSRAHQIESQPCNQNPSPDNS